MKNVILRSLIIAHYNSRFRFLRLQRARFNISLYLIEGTFGKSHIHVSKNLFNFVKCIKVCLTMRIHMYTIKGVYICILKGVVI